MSDPPSSPGVHASARDVLAGLVGEQRRRWQGGERALVETLLEKQPPLREDPEAVVDLIYNEILLREERGETPQLAEYVQRFPHLADELAVQFEVDQGFRRDAQAVVPVTRKESNADRRAPSALAAPAGLVEYELLEELGRGGMGVVYKARQVGLNRLVALKMVLAGAHAAPDDLARFRTEAEAVASLQHANIVQIYEIGERDGAPFLALEYLGGGSLAQKLQGVPQPPAEAAKLIETLAHAIHHAHQQGIIHRDLKPANVLLSFCGGSQNRADGGPAPVSERPQNEVVPKITDFGLAKWLARPAPSGDAAGLTRSGDILGTPSYMAPEQAAGHLPSIGPATDIYALGAILYEMLTGRPPFRAATLVDTLVQVQTREPVSPARLQPGVPRDLDTICLKCLEKAPGKRYASARALAEDLRCFLAGRPIQARPVGPWERAWKWARRRPTAAALLAVSAVAVLALLVGGWWSSAALGRAAQREAGQRHRAENRFRDALDVVDRLLTEVAEVDLIDVPQMEPVRARLLRRAQGYYEKFLRQDSNDPMVRREAGRAHVRLGDIQDMLGQSAAAQRSYRRALDWLGRLTEEFPHVAVYRQDLARAQQGLAVLARKTNHFDQAERAGREALRLRRQLVDEYPDEPEYQRDLAASSYHLGALLARLPGRQKEAEQAYRASLAWQRDLVKRFPDGPDYLRDQARTLNNLGILLQARGRSDKAEEAIERAAHLQQRLAKGSPTVAAYRRELARYHANLGSLRRARRLPRSAEKSYDAARVLLAALAADFPTVPGYRQELAAVQSNLGLLYQFTQRPQKAATAFQEALALRRQLADLPDDRHKLADTLVKWGYLLAVTGRPRAAERAYREALGIERGLMAKHPTVAAYHSGLGSALNHLARVLADRGAFWEREQLLELWVRNAWGSPLHSLEPLLEARSALVEARRCLDQAIKEHSRALRAEPRNALFRYYLRNDHSLQATVLLRLGDHAAAVAQAEELPRLFPASRNDNLHAARFLARAVALAQHDRRLSPDRRRAVVERYGERAVALLRQAVARGLRTAGELSQPVYAPLRGRDDFRRLQRALAAKKPAGSAP
jgi:serine/threonine-protein kinase